MSVFTPITDVQLQQLLASQALKLVDFSAAAEGIENSNFFVTALDLEGKKRQLVLTIMEGAGRESALWFHGLLTGLATDGLPVPAPLGSLQEFAGKPVLLAPRLAGQHVTQASPAQATAIGKLLAQLHQHTPRTPPFVGDERQRLQKLAGHIDLLPGDWQAQAHSVMADWLAGQGEYRLIHGDLFRDNALFVGDKLSGVLDFYHACCDLPVYDLAVALNDWALDEKGTPLPHLGDALLAGYRRVASVPTPELLTLALAAAALRFWLSRSVAQQQSRHASAGRGTKPPAEFAAKFALRWRMLTAGQECGD